MIAELAVDALLCTATEDVVKIVNISRRWRIPIIPSSGQTSLEGHLVISPGNVAIILSFEDMDQIIEVNEGNLDAVVQPGVGWSGLNEHLKEQGIPLFFPVE